MHTLPCCLALIYPACRIWLLVRMAPTTRNKIALTCWLSSIITLLRHYNHSNSSTTKPLTSIRLSNSSNYQSIRTDSINHRSNHILCTRSTPPTQQPGMGMSISIHKDHHLSITAMNTVSVLKINMTHLTFSKILFQCWLCFHVPFPMFLVFVTSIFVIYLKTKKYLNLFLFSECGYLDVQIDKKP